MLSGMGIFQMIKKRIEYLNLLPAMSLKIHAIYFLKSSNYPHMYLNLA